MSFLRYHIGWKIANQESTHKTYWYMVVLVILYGIFDHFNLGPLSFFGTIYIDMPTSATNCAGLRMDGLPLIQVFHFTKAVVIATIGVRYDVLMIGFLKKRNTHREPGQAKLVPWKSSGQEYNFMVPIIATVTSVLTGIFGIVICVTLIKNLMEDKSEAWKYNGFAMNFCCSLQMPVMILQTLRAAKHKKTAPVIPRRLMFHENVNIDMDETIEMQEIAGNNDQGEKEFESLSSHESVFPPPRIIYVKPIEQNAECHM